MMCLNCLCLWAFWGYLIYFSYFLYIGAGLHLNVIILWVVKIVVCFFLGGEEVGRPICLFINLSVIYVVLLIDLNHVDFFSLTLVQALKNIFSYKAS